MQGFLVKQLKPITTNYTTGKIKQNENPMQQYKRDQWHTTQFLTKEKEGINVYLKLRNLEPGVRRET